MRSDEGIKEVANKLLEPKNLGVVSVEPLQSLWAGYGQIVRLQAIPISSEASSQMQSLILKLVTPPTDASKARDEGHLRKVISYQVEQYFYSHLASSMPPSLAVSSCLASLNEQSNASSTIAMVLSDLKESFPLAGEKRGELNETQVNSAIRWLATFHGIWWKRRNLLRDGGLRKPPLEEAQNDAQGGGVWLNGGYTYLATRRKEYRSLCNDQQSEWSSLLCRPVASAGQSIAELVAKVLSPSANEGTRFAISDYETLIHGDVKSENLFTTTSGDAVAFYDFQYVGLGLGVCDLAKLFTCSVPLELLAGPENTHQPMSQGEHMLLEPYRQTLQETSGKDYPWDLFEQHWNTALVDWLRFQASWGFWGNTEWLEGRVRYILKDEKWKAWLLEAVGEGA
ncbi:hypothetical protein CLAFUW4_02606 [Fulvia fulva]|uniref:Aminoglycoside phosphotransferase domain-containing protein n=1 Tax=Passalora fulva TaxID=5499 RepID=A0A9Q8L9U9_PASFU|nr:uncharacterized protein CLAFUR5_02594 [Fulvia fulva]UJO13452.1 hypothetical protein CLAFUR5_02594 [Fulvia fulva]WPV10800.1 hypothetical protein CLAFUW4_02606 [Fulvia fulva]